MRLLSQPEFQHLIGISRGSFFKLRREGKLPTPVHLTDKRIAWLESHIIAWLENGGVIPAVTPSARFDQDDFLTIAGKGRASGQSWQVIADDLNLARFPTPSGTGKWHSGNVSSKYRKLCKPA